MADAAFDPDKYIAEKAKATVQSNSFDPDKYIAEKSANAQPRPWYSVTPKGLLDAVETTGRSALETATLGASEPVLSGMNALSETARSGNLSVDELKKNYAADVERRRQLKENAPISNIGGALGGAFSPVGPAASVAGKVAGAVGKGAGVILPEVESGGNALVQGAKNLYGNASNIATGAAEGAAGAVAQEAPRQAIEGTTGFIKKDDKNVPDLGSVAAMGGKFGAGLAALNPIARGIDQGASYSGKKLLSSFLGPSEEHIDYYMKNPEAVNGAKSIEELKDKVDGVTDKLREDVTNGSKSVDEAKSDLRDIEQAVAEHRRQSNFDYQVTATQVKQSFRDAKSDLDNAFEGKVRALNAVKAPTELADEASQAVKDLKGKVIEGSRQATDALADQGGHVETFSPYRALQDAKSRLNVAGKGPVTPQAKAAAAEIDKLSATFGALPGHLSFEETKHLIKQLDQSEQAIYNSGEFTGDVSNAYKSLRSNLDTQLKSQNPQYAEAMKPVSEDMKLHSEVAPAFGDRQAAISNLSRIGSPTSQVNRENLVQLGQKTGRDFDTPVNGYLAAQNTLKNPDAMDAIKQGLPEYGRAQDMEKASRMLEGPEAKAEYVQNNLKNSGLMEKQAQQEGLLLKRQEGLLGAKGMLEPYKNFTPNSSEARLKTAMRARPGEQVELKSQLDGLSKMSDTDFVKELQNLRTNQAFKGQDTNGSRKVNLFGMIIGGASAGMLGLMGHGVLGAEVGVPIGATLGAVADKYGPAMTKKMLDGALKIQGSPNLAKIQALKIPPQVKAVLAKEFADYNGEQ